MPYPVSSQLNSLDLCGLVLVASSTASETGDAWHMATQGLPAKDLQSAVSMRLGPGGAHGRLDQLRPVSFPHSPRLRSSAGTAQAKVPTSALFSVAWRAWDHERAVKQHPGICGPITAWQHQQTCSSSWHAAVLLHLKPLREVQVVGSDASQG